jgi:phosphoglycolate phosphatase
LLTDEGGPSEERAVVGSLSQPRVVLFDFDYTLGDSSVGIVESVTFALAQTGFSPPPSDRILDTIGLSLEAAFYQLTGCTDTATAKAFVVGFHERADDVLEAATVLYPAVSSVLETLRRHGMRTGVVTTKLRRRLARILTRNGVRGAFDVLVGAEDVSRSKPDPSGILLALTSLSTPPRAAVYVGDHVIDAEAAWAAGVPFIGTLSGTSPRAALAKCPHRALVDGVEDVPSVLGLEG